MIGLSKYARLPVQVSPHDAWVILRTFFGAVPAAGQLDANDRRFAQALVLEAAEASAKMNIVQQLFESAMSPVAKPGEVFKAAAKAVIKYLARNKSLAAAVDSPKYTAVINTLRRNFRSVWAIRIQTEDSSMLMD